jgi:hypothetical protein
MRRRIDAQRHPARDRHPGGSDPAGERASHLQPVRRRRPGADDGDGVLIDQLEQPRHAAGDMEHGRFGRQ